MFTRKHAGSKAGEVKAKKFPIHNVDIATSATGNGNIAKPKQKILI